MGTNGFAVCKRQHRNLGAGKKFFNDICWLPLSPNTLSSIIDRTAAFASSLVSAMITPLPSARPSALITVGIGAVSKITKGRVHVVKTPHMPPWEYRYFFIRFFANTLLPSMMAALSLRSEAGHAGFFQSRPPRLAPSGSSGRNNQQILFVSCFAKATISVNVLCA